jgi:hypothetical protein
MAHKIDIKEMIPLEKLLLSTIQTQERLIKLLERKGLLTREEIGGEMTRTVRGYERKIWN